MVTEEFVISGYYSESHKDGFALTKQRTISSKYKTKHGAKV